VYDDHRLILENTSLTDLHNWRALLYHDISRPLVNLSYAIDYAIWGGPDAVGFHLTNLAIHVVNILLLYSVASALADDHSALRHDRGRTRNTAAVAAALLFAVHPVLTQAVGYVSSRAELLCAMFLMAALMAGRRAMRGGPWWLWPATAGCWLAALACKEIAVMFPFALLAYDYLVAPIDQEQRRRRIWRLHAPFIGLTLLVGAIRVAVLLTIEYSNPTVRLRFGLVELDVFRRYIQLLLVPVRQTIFHAIDPIQRVTDPHALLGIATILLFVFVIWRLRSQDVVSFGLAWFALLLAPSAVLVILDRGEPMSEGRIYTASAGFFLSVGAIAALVLERAGRISALTERRTRDIGFAIVALLAVRTTSRNAVWHDAVGLWLESAELAPGHWLPRVALGEALHEEGRHEEAIAMFREALVLRPNERLTYAKLGQCQLETDQMEAAEITFKSLEALDPGSTVASTGLGLIALRARDSRTARQHFLEILAKEPNNVPMRQILASIAEQTDPAEALRWCEEIKRLAPETPGNDECIRRNRERLETEAGPPR
jgi:protein O-mannosyl-transferase